MARWLDDASRVLDEIAEAGRPAVIVGGTGLYFTALTAGLSDVPPIPEQIRSHWRGRAAGTGAAGLHAELARRDPVMAGRLRPSDAQRVVRALEVLDATGRSLADWQGERSRPLVARGEAVAAVVAPERAWLHGRIEARFRQMAATGGLDEAAALADLGLDPALPAMKAIGVPEMMAAATGRLTIDEAIAAAVTATRRYAKRQETWFRNQMPGWLRITPDQPDAVDVLSGDSA